MLELKNISKIYQTGDEKIHALNQISCTFNNQEFVSIIGPSGCGKTTLLNIIGGLDEKDAGDIIINGVSTLEYKAKDWDNYRNKHIGFIFQNYHLIPHLSVYENIELSLSLAGIPQHKKREQILEACCKVGIQDQIKKKPNQLSGGQMQRVAIARAIVNHPSIILADEPTGALDSKTSIQIMDVLKEISKDCLVIMVTHNVELAYQYSTRVIKMLDGTIEETNIVPQVDKERIAKKNKNNKKSSMSIFTALHLSFRNLFTKKFRTLLTILACSVGIISLSMVLTVTNGMNLYISDFQKESLKTYPVTITSVVDNEEPEEENPIYQEYPSENIVHIVNEYRSYSGHVNTFTNEFMNHVKTMPEEYYTVIGYSGWLRMRILTKNQSSYRYISSTSYLKEINPDLDYLEDEYDLLAGEGFPNEKEEIALVIDKNNCIDITVLSALGIDYDGKESFRFEDLLGKEYKVVENNDYYQKVNDIYVSSSSSKNEQLYQQSKIALKITAILRQKKTAQTKLYGTSLLYTSLLTDYMLESNLSSDIVKEQQQYGLEKNVLTGRPYQDIVGETYTQTKEYQLESNLSQFGAVYSITRISIYTDKFENFSKIQDYVDIYNEGKVSDAQIQYTDRLKSLTNEFETFIRVITKILVIFSSISLAVSSIMIAIITYISVMERIKEIGILRSVGARRVDITRIFVVENGVIGLLAGVIGITLGIIFIRPILKNVVQIMSENNVTYLDITSLSSPSFNPLHLTLLVIGSVVLTILAGLIPAIMASFQSPVKALRQE